MQKFGIEKLRIYATADNLALWSKRQGFDPNSEDPATAAEKVLSGSS
jgi:hypothetical protein